MKIPFAWMFQETEDEKAVKKRVKTAVVRNKKSNEQAQAACKDLHECLQQASSSRCDLPKVNGRK